MLAKLFALGLVLSPTLASPQGPPAADPCKCEVVNKVYGVGDCKCTITGQGEVPAFSYSTPVFPEGIPQHGVCNQGTCPGNNMCTYKPIQITITIAACARTCTGHEAADPGVPWKREVPPEMAAVESTGTWGFGSSTTITSGVPNVGNPNMCGQGPFEEKITFYKWNGQEAYKVVFQFGCGNCRGQ